MLVRCSKGCGSLLVHDRFPRCRCCRPVICLLRIYAPPLRLMLSAYIAFYRNTRSLCSSLWVAYAWYDIFAWPKTFSLQPGCARVDRAGISQPKHFEPGSKACRMAACGSESLCAGHGPIWCAAPYSRAANALTMAPALMNQFIVIVKCSTLVSVIPVPDSHVPSNSPYQHLG